MNTLLWLTSGILVQGGGITPEPPMPPIVASAGGGQRRRFIVQGKRGYVVISDPRLIAFFQRVLGGEEPTEDAIAYAIAPLAIEYGVRLNNNIQVLSDILDKLEVLQEVTEDEAKEQKYQEQLRTLEAQVLLDQTREEEAELVAEETLESRRLEMEEARLSKQLTTGLEIWADSLCRSAKEEANLRTAHSMVKTERVRKLQLRIDQWRKALV
jgi:hypothetical protein